MIPSQMLKGLLEGAILEIIHQEETYAYEISKKLEAYGFGEISEGTIYPIILRLQSSQCIQGEQKPSPQGPKRKYYRLTAVGIKQLAGFKNNWSLLSNALDQLLQKESSGDKDA
ncbi:PadR family transcriptional regulator [Streptococcus iniae]|uniref:PadR family transcriptional regulator n=1 Tax=Streptococcus iniae TaxID=1346 RepID=A0A1J0MXG6_STRIN|nr:PadR family transcriptional regulator [Streptococcus iniae]AGM98167.1 transcriptional regulator, PadR family [Streptococcus iniae SF1]AHY15232.1 PadR family transcriptional regulator [Streptococcus iniae]AHY17101.1 PadR family transcriptional regulator [Streptococcus iniae]AJG25413.1 PadR family transcriptional regulator [Streptococcus iniae]APD31283.1 PadR family transcriptional regulator [Streptococcus iniae]